MGTLTFALNITLDGCIDHREGVADDELHLHYTSLMKAAGAMLWGRTTYELMEEYWPLVASGQVEAPPALLDWAVALQAKPKYVLSRSRTEYSWENTHAVSGDLGEAIAALKEATPDGVLLGSASVAAQLDALGLVDEYRFLLHPVIAGHGPRLFGDVLQAARVLELVETRPLGNGCLDVRYRRA